MCFPLLRDLCPVCSCCLISNNESCILSDCSATSYLKFTSSFGDQPFLLLSFSHHRKRGSIDYHFLGTPSDSSVITPQGSSHGLDKTLSLLYSSDSRKWLGEVCPWKENGTVSVVQVLASLGPQSSHVL